MKKFIICSLLYIISVAVLGSEPLRIGIISDTHYLSEQLMDDDYAVDNYIYTSARDIKNVPVLLDSVFSDYIKSNIQVLLISGDITKDGEKQSHIDFVKKLKPLQDRGIRIFVVPGNHDINTNKAKRYVGNKTFDAENTTPEDFVSIYGDCGYNNALQRDSMSLSYLAAIDHKTWLLSIDIHRYNGHATPIVTATTMGWIRNILEEARKKQIQVIGMMHWGLVEHFPDQAILFPGYLIQEREYLASQLADNGMKVMFTGHFHSNDISAFESKAGNTIYDIETGPLCSYPFVYRFAELTDAGINISSKNITSLPQAPLLAGQNKALLKQLAYKRAMYMLKRSSRSDADNPTMEKLTDVISQLFLLHVAGDEVIDEDLKAEIKELSEILGDLDETDINDIMNLDFPPADNNVFIKF